jgi:hypothetical protein
MQGGANQVNAKAFVCACGQTLNTALEISKHSFECMQMQQDGYSQFVQVLNGLMQSQNVPKTYQ